MKTKKVSASLPLLAGIGLGAVSLVVPFLLANHYIFAQNVRYSVDNYLFFFWGKYYTVTGANLIQSKMVMYDLGDFPVYAMMVTIVGLALGTISLFGGRGVILNVKGRDLKLKFNINPVWLQLSAVGLVTMSYVYMIQASELLTATLTNAAYTVEQGPALNFMLGSIISMTISTIMTAMKFLKVGKAKDGIPNRV